MSGEPWWRIIKTHDADVRLSRRLRSKTSVAIEFWLPRAPQRRKLTFKPLRKSADQKGGAMSSPVGAFFGGLVAIILLALFMHH